MKAVIAIGGKGNRIAPLSYEFESKSFIPICNKTILERTLENLPKDISEVVLSGNYNEHIKAAKRIVSKTDIKAKFEKHPYGCPSFALRNVDEPVLFILGDALFEPAAASELIQKYEKTGISYIVKEPAKLSDTITWDVKDDIIQGLTLNTHPYFRPGSLSVFSRDALNIISGRIFDCKCKQSVFNRHTFFEIAKKAGMGIIDRYSININTVNDYVNATSYLLSTLYKKQFLIGENCNISDATKILPNTVIGNNVDISAKKIANSVVYDDSVVENDLRGNIIKGKRVIV